MHAWRCCMEGCEVALWSLWCVPMCIGCMCVRYTCDISSTGTYNDKQDQYRCKPCATAHMTGSKLCQPWPSECTPSSSRWCARDPTCKPICRRGMYYDSKEGKCVRCPYGTYQFLPRTGCCRVRTCPEDKIPGPSRYNGIFPPLCVKKPKPTAAPALKCCSDGTCNYTQGRCAPHPCTQQQTPPPSVLCVDQSVQPPLQHSTVCHCPPLALFSCSSTPH